MIPFPFDLSLPWVSWSIAAFCAWLLICTLRYLIFFTKVKEMVPIKGKITSFDFKKRSLDKERGDYLKVSYSYTYEGNEYVNDKLTPIDRYFPFTFSSEQKVIRRIYRDCQRSELIRVYISRRRPNVSYLALDLQFSRIVLAMFFLIVLLAILLVINRGLG